MATACIIYDSKQKHYYQGRCQGEIVWHTNKKKALVFPNIILATLALRKLVQDDPFMSARQHIVVQDVAPTSVTKPSVHRKAA